MKWQSIILFAGFLVLASCKTLNLPAPEYSGISRIYNPSPSCISIPVQIPLSAIEDIINKKLFGLVYQDDSYESPTDDDLKLNLTVNERIRLKGQGNIISFQIPLNIWAKYRWSVCRICPELEKETDFNIEVSLQSEVELKKDYALKMTTTFKGLQWKKDPTVSIGPIEIPIKRFVEDIILNQVKDAILEIDKNVNTSANLKSQINQLWALIQEPVLIDDSTYTWLKIKPSKLKVKPLNIENQIAALQIGLESFLETNTGTKPEPEDKIMLPDLIFENISSPRFNINVRSLLGYEKASSMAKSALSGQSFSFRRKKITVENIEIFGKGDKVYFHLYINGSVKGEIFLSGIPQFDSEKNELFFQNLDYDINTKNILVKSANWVMGTMIQQKIENKLRFSFDNEVKNIKTELDNTIKNFRYKDLFAIKGTLDSFTVRDIFLSGDHFEIVLSAGGEAYFLIEKFEF